MTVPAGTVTRAGALVALALLFSAPLVAAENQLPGAFARQPSYGGGDSASGAMEGSYTLLSVNRDQLNIASIEASNVAGATPGETFPGTSDSAFQLYGGGAMIQKGPSRWGVVAMSGGLAAGKDGENSNWGLDMVCLVAEQRYPGNGWEVTAGFLAGYGQLAIDYRGATFSRYESRFIATGATAGARWPSDSRLSFFIRSGYLWIPANGAWQGALGGKMARTYFDLSAPFAQAGMDLIF